MTLPAIQLINEGQPSELTATELLRHAVPVPAETARFVGQVVVHLDELLPTIDDHRGEQRVSCRSPRGECYSFPTAELSRFSLLSTNTPSWKLIPAGRDQLAEITGPRFVLREVASIEIGAAESTSGLSDQVFTNLTDALLQPDTVRFLNLTSAGLEQFPKGIFELVNLESLNLGKNSIRSLPAQIGELRQLKVLKMSRNRLTTLPEEIGRLKQLTELHLSRNEIASLPEKFWNLTELELINLGHNSLTHLPAELAQLTRLRELELDHNPIPLSERSTIAARVPQAKIEW